MLVKMTLSKKVKKKNKKKFEWVRINLFATGINIVSTVKWFQLLKNYSSKCHQGLI